MKNKKAIIIGVIVVIAIAALVIVAFWTQNKKVKPEAEPEVDVSQVMELLLRDIDKSYPPTPKEVLKYYSEITCCFYNDSLSEEELRQLAERSYMLYDPELQDHMPFDTYFESLKQEVVGFQAQKIVVSGYSVSAAADVDRFTEDGFEWARLYATYRMRQGTEYMYSDEVFIMRKDDEGHWRIYGFTLAPEGDAPDTYEETVMK